jgi:hypothetical protein
VPVTFRSDGFSDLISGSILRRRIGSAAISISRAPEPPSSGVTTFS